MKSKVFWGILGISLLLFAPLAFGAEQPGTVAYKIDGKSFSFKDARLEFSAGDGFITITRDGTEEVAVPAEPNRKIEVNLGMSIELAVEEKALVGVHEAKTGDAMPVYFSWYEIETDKETKDKMIKDVLASLDNGDEKQQSFRLKIDNFGPAGTVIKGSFSGKLFDEDGKLHEITDGVFAIPREDVKEH